MQKILTSELDSRENIFPNNMIPDAVHVAKRIRGSFANWFLWIDNCRTNLVLLRELRNDKLLYPLLSPLVPLSAVRNRDRQEVDSLLQISQEDVCKVISENVSLVTHTVVPEKFRLCEDNKKGVLKTPISVALGSLGNIFVSDIVQGKVFKVRASHYPAGVTVEADSLDNPTGIALYNNFLFVVESAANSIYFKDLVGTTIVNVNMLTVKQLKDKIRSSGSWHSSDARKDKKALKDKLKGIIASINKSTEKKSKDRIHLYHVTGTPFAITFNEEGNLFLSTETGIIIMFQLAFNMISIEANKLKEFNVCDGSIYGMVVLNSDLYATSVSSGIFKLN